MSTVAVTLPRGRPRARQLAGAAVRRDAVVLGAVLVWLGVLVAATWGTWGDPAMDTGYDLLAGARVADGQLPYADFVYYYGPLGPLLMGGTYAVTGAAVWPAIVLGLVLAVAAVVLTYTLARVFVAPGWAGLAAALVATSAASGANNSYILPHTLSAPLALVLALGALNVLARAGLRSAGRRPYVVAGTCCGLVALTRPETAIALYAGVGLWLALGLWHAPPPQRDPARRAALAIIAPAVVLPAVVYGAFATSVGLHALLLENLFPRDYLRSAGHVVLDAHAPWTAGSFATLAVRLVAYGAGIAGLVGLARVIDRGGRARTVALAAVGVAVLVFLAVLAFRADTVRYYLQWAWKWLPAGTLVVGLLLVRRRDDGPALLLTAVLGVAALMTYAAFTPFPNALHPDATAYLMPLAAVFLLWLHVGLVGRRGATVAALGGGWLALLVVANAGLVLHDARPETVTVRAAHGSLTARPADGPALQQTIAFLERESRPGDKVLLAPQLTALYVLTGRRDPLEQLSLLPGALGSVQDEEAAIARMGHVRIAAIDRTPQTTYDHGSFGTTFDRRLARWLHTNFDHIATVRGSGTGARSIDLWKRSTP